MNILSSGHIEFIALFLLRYGDQVTEARISLIAAVAENGVIGHLGKMPWRVPSDLALFKKVTMGKPIIMGRKTFDSIGKPLHRRYNIVVSRKRKKIPGSIVCPTLTSALSRGLELASRQQQDPGELMVVGGGEIYRASLAYAHRMYITRIDGEYEGDAYFPEFSSRDWIMTKHFPAQKDANDEASYHLEIWDRANMPQSVSARGNIENLPDQPGAGEFSLGF